MGKYKVVKLASSREHCLTSMNIPKPRRTRPIGRTKEGERFYAGCVSQIFGLAKAETPTPTPSGLWERSADLEGSLNSAKWLRIKRPARQLLDGNPRLKGRRTFQNQARISLSSHRDWVEFDRSISGSAVAKISLGNIKDGSDDTCFVGWLDPDMAISLGKAICKGIVYGYLKIAETSVSMSLSGSDVVKLAEIFVRVPSFALAYGAFAKLYEDEGYLANHKAAVLSKLLELCSIIYNFEKSASNLLNRSELEGSRFMKAILTCFVCKSYLYHPIVLFCGHTFCRKCISAPFMCHCCSLINPPGEISECLLITKVIEILFPDAAAVFHRLDEATTLVERGEYAKASAIHNELIITNPTSHLCLQAKAECCLLMSDLDGALKYTDTGLSLHPYWPKFFCLKARTLNQLERRREALEYFFKCFTIYPKAECLRTSINHILEEVISPSDIVKWKRIVELCVSSKEPISEVLANLTDDLRSSINLEPWMHFPSTRNPESLDQNPFYSSSESAVATMADDRPPQDLLDGLHDDFQCALCLRLFFHPYSLPCGHTFCRECIEKSLDYRPECPLCKANLSHYVSSSGRGISSVIWKLVKYLFPEEVAERQNAYELENLALSKVGMDPDVEMPIMTCCLAFPGMPCPLHVHEPRYRTMVRRALDSGSRRFGIFMTNPNSARPAEVGTVLQIKSCEPLPDGRLLIDTRGCARVRMLNARVVDGCTVIMYEFLRDSPVPDENKEAFAKMCSNVHSMAAEWLAQLPCRTRASLVPFFGGLPSIDSPAPEGPDNGPRAWVWWLVAVLPLNDICRYKLLSCCQPEFRMEKLKCILTCLAAEPSRSSSPRHLMC
ncbi:unnamed protein product [Calicophoron daubneyi]|uniref:Uncharacterized protein n=1 Tax=Calicophoron daubneyi TaxID=300641 RepID=A0AAV2TPV4_CALDB